MTMDLRFSVIVPVWNSPDLIAKCLTALEDQSFPRDRYEVIVVDNGSTDQTAEVIARFPGVTMLSERKPGSYAARNRGLAEARGEFVAFTDADCIPHRDWLTAADEAIGLEPGKAIYGGRMTLFASDEDSPVCRAYEEIFSFDQRKYLATGHCVTANWVSPLSLIRDLGGFDAKLKSGGDFDMSGRISRRGLPIVYVPEMQVAHPYRGSPIEIVNKKRRTIGGSWTMRTTAKARLKLAAWVVFAFGQDVRRVWQGSEIGSGLKLRLSLLLTQACAAQLGEIGRLALGGEARRS
ncbi:MAG TPA: glycosyltransferase [Kaistia sp.]|nr:glycosyltransferase [Kaistia sp.]